MIEGMDKIIISNWTNYVSTNLQHASLFGEGNHRVINYMYDFIGELCHVIK